MPAILKKLPRRKCSVCKKWFHPTRDGQFVCSFDCACRYGKVANDTAKAEAQREKKRVKKVERKRQAERRQAVKPLSYFIRQAQQAFNEFIR
ncbi:recombination protein NinG [Citrobacter braakii]|uniref:recombination protein NinG n=1 Tax=Citrobacter TaxID=544 RepID=UPI002574D294|nr:recombination protein NinG [Citrobacter sp. Cb011]MDM3386574.1 recombination protein NinG [Citrobacter sp. Cb011]